MFKKLLLSAVLATSAMSASAASIGFDITFGGSGNTPSFTLENTSAPGVTLDTFGLTIGDTTYAFDFIQPTPEQRAEFIAANGTSFGSFKLVAPDGGSVTIVKGDRKNEDGNLHDELVVAFTSFDVGDVFKFIVDVDLATGITFGNFRETFFNNMTTNSILTATFSDGERIVFELPDASLDADSYTYNLSSVPVPAGLPLLAGGLGMFAWMRRRKG